MRVLLSTSGSRGDVEPMAALAAALLTLGAEAVVFAPPDPEFADVMARAGAFLAPAFMPVWTWIEAAKRSSDGLPQHAARMIAVQHEAIGAAAEGCELLVATGLLPPAAAAQCGPSNAVSPMCTPPSARCSCRLTTTSPIPIPAICIRRE